MLALLLLVMCCISSSAAQPGSYNDGSGVKPCDLGTFSVAREAGSATSCTKCAEGSISGPGASECIVCPAGMFYVSSSECRHCDAGKYSKMPGSKECLNCAAGYGSSRTSSICTPCPRGSASAGGRACGICPAGSYADNVGSTICTYCAARTASSVVGATDKSQCIRCKNQPRIGFTPAGSAVCY